MDYTQGLADGAEAHRTYHIRVAWPISSVLQAQMFGCPTDAPDEYRRGWIDGFNERAEVLRAKLDAALRRTHVA